MPSRAEQPVGEFGEKIVTYFDKLHSANTGTEVTPYVRFFPNGEVCIGKFVSDVYHINLTLTKEDMEVLIFAMTHEIDRYYTAEVEEPKEVEDDPNLDIFNDFLKDK